MRTAYGAAALALLLACGPESDPLVFELQAHSFAHSEWSAPVNLGAAINSSAADDMPSISKNGLTLYFRSNRPGGAGGNDIWVAQRHCVDCPWEAPVNLAVLNTPGSDGGAELSDNELLLFFFSERPGSSAQDIYVSRRTDPNDDFGWGPPENLGPLVNSALQDNLGDVLRGNVYFNRTLVAGVSDLWQAPVSPHGEALGPAVLIAELSDPAANDVSPSIRTDEREIVFASNRAGTHGLNDIWVSTRRSTNDAWSTPVNLGPLVNSSVNELSPSLSPDGRILLFDSPRPGGVGDRDLWMSTRTPSGK